MPRLSKKYFFLGIAVAGLGVLGAAVFPRGEELRPVLDDLTIWIQRPLYDEQRRFLSVHLPGFLPIKLTCRFQLTKGDWHTVLPGDSAQGFVEGADLFCSNGDTFHLHPGSSVRLWSRRGNQTFLELQRGWVSGVAARQPVRLGLGVAEVDIRPRTATQFLATANGRDEAYLDILSGHAQLGAARRVDAPLLLESTGGRLDIQRAGEPERFTMVDGERTYLDDLSLPLLARPEIPEVKGAAKPRAELAGGGEGNAIALRLGTEANGKRRVVASSPHAQEDCGLFAYRPGQEPRELHPFPALNKEYVSEVPPNARPPLFVECRIGDVVHASNFLTSLKAPEAAEPVPAPAAIAAPAPASVAPAAKKTAKAAAPTVATAPAAKPVPAPTAKPKK